MFVGLLPRWLTEALLLLVILGFGFLIFRSVRRRRAFAEVAPDPGVELPGLVTPQRVAGILRRVWRDPAQGVWLGEIALGKRKFTFCAADHGENAERYQELLGKQTDMALYGLATLVPGGADAMKDQIKDYDKVEVTPDLVRLIPAGQFANDYAVIGRVLSHREEKLDGIGVYVYRMQLVRSNELTLVLELAAERADAPLPDQTMAHGSARLYGYLPEPANS